MSDTHEMKRNDTAPKLIATLKDAEGQPRNIDGATVNVHVDRSSASATSIDRAVDAILDAPNGKVQVNFTAQETSVEGSFPMEFEVTFVDGEIETWPTSKNATLKITADLA